MTKWGIDVDGILADFIPSMVSTLNSLFKLDLPSNFMPTDWNWQNANLEPHMMKEAWEVIKATPNFWESLPPIKDIITMADWFYDHGDQ